MSQRGFSALEFMAALAISGLLLSIAIPSFGAMKMSMNFRSGEQALQMVLARARWSAINSARAETRIAIEGSVVRVRAGAAVDSPVVAELNVTDYNMAVSGTNLPVQLDARGMRLNVSAPTLTVTNSRISEARTFTVGPLGKITAS
jgi:prepilin-type N-terminal cleavage/methylation domain-containing protein